MFLLSSHRLISRVSQSATAREIDYCTILQYCIYYVREVSEVSEVSEGPRRQPAKNSPVLGHRGAFSWCLDFFR